MIVTSIAPAGHFFVQEYDGGSHSALYVYNADSGTPEPVIVSPADIATGGSLAWEYQCVLVKVTDVTVVDSNPDTPDDFDDLTINDGLRVVIDLYTILPDPAQDDTFTSLTGVLTYTLSECKLLPRDASDVIL